jgi:uncharacterized protein YdeI (YjbR/CyaY-like superfamily)
MHKIPSDLQKILTSQKSMQQAWDTITPLAKNEWICWIESAKKLETRKKRLDRAYTEIQNGKRRPCCWAGCVHR